MSLNGKRDHFEFADLLAFGEFCDLKPRKAERIIREIHDRVEAWSDYAEEAGVSGHDATRIYKVMRREIVIPKIRPILES